MTFVTGQRVASVMADLRRALPRGVRGRGGRGDSSRPGYPTFADGHDEMLVGEAIARESRWVDVDRSGSRLPTVTTEAPR